MGRVRHQPVTAPGKGGGEGAYRSGQDAALVAPVLPVLPDPEHEPTLPDPQASAPIDGGVAPAAPANPSTQPPNVAFLGRALRRQLTAASSFARRRLRGTRSFVRWRFDAATPTYDTQADLAFWGALLLVVALTLLLLAQAGAALSRPLRAGPPEPTAPPIPANLTATVREASVQTYTLPNPDAGLMQPAVDQAGNVWVGEMTANRLAELDPKTGQVRAWEPPHSLHTIMATQVDAQGRVWFTEQAANYVGRFDPATQTFKTYSLPKSDGHTSGPQDLRFDASGKLYVTLASAGRIGRLDPATGALDTWPVPAPAPGVHPTPWALAVTPTGQVWFGLLSGGAVGRLDPSSGQVTLMHLADSQAAVFSMAADGHGRVYFTELQAGKLGVIETASGKLREMDVPRVLGDPESLYAITAAPNGDAWFESAGANAIVRFSPQTGAFAFYKLPIPSSVPYGIALDAAGKVWFAADDGDGNYIGAVTPMA